MDFYTSVERFGNQLLYRGYSDGQQVKKKIPFKPTLFVNGDTGSGWSSLDGRSVEPMTFDSMRDATDFTKRYEHVDNFKTYGMNNFVSQFIAEKFPVEIKYNRDEVSNSSTT
jgi:hypothetical protein